MYQRGLLTTSATSHVTGPPSNGQVPPAIKSNTTQLTIGDVDYEADRTTDGHGLGYIELRQPGSNEPLARINYHGPDTPMDVCTYGVPLPLPVVLWLIERAEYALA